MMIRSTQITIPLIITTRTAFSMDTVSSLNLWNSTVKSCSCLVNCGVRRSHHAVAWWNDLTNHLPNVPPWPSLTLTRGLVTVGVCCCGCSWEILRDAGFSAMPLVGMSWVSGREGEGERMERETEGGVAMKRSRMREIGEIEIVTSVWPVRVDEALITLKGNFDISHLKLYFPPVFPNSVCYLLGTS